MYFSILSINTCRYGDMKNKPAQRIYVSSHSIARVIGRGGSNINAIREASGAHIEVEKQQKNQTDRLITIKYIPMCYIVYRFFGVSHV